MKSTVSSLVLHEVSLDEKSYNRALWTRQIEGCNTDATTPFSYDGQPAGRPGLRTIRPHYENEKSQKRAVINHLDASRQKKNAKHPLFPRFGSAFAKIQLTNANISHFFSRFFHPLFQTGHFFPSICRLYLVRFWDEASLFFF